MNIIMKINEDLSLSATPEEFLDDPQKIVEMFNKLKVWYDTMMQAYKDTSKAIFPQWEGSVKWWK